MSFAALTRRYTVRAFSRCWRRSCSDFRSLPVPEIRGYGIEPSASGSARKHRQSPRQARRSAMRWSALSKESAIESGCARGAGSALPGQCAGSSVRVVIVPCGGRDGTGRSTALKIAAQVDVAHLLRELQAVLPKSKRSDGRPKIFNLYATGRCRALGCDAGCFRGAGSAGAAWSTGRARSAERCRAE